MTDIDIKPFLTEWYKLSTQLRELKEEEMEMRKFIFKALFPHPRIGVNTYGLGDGYFLRATQDMNRKIDMAAFRSGRDTFEGEGISVDTIVKYKPELSLTVYNKLTEEQKAVFDFCLVSTPASPSFEIVKGKS